MSGILCHFGLHRWPKVCSRSMFVTAPCVRGCGAEQIMRPAQWYPADYRLPSETGAGSG